MTPQVDEGSEILEQVILCIKDAAMPGVVLDNRSRRSRKKNPSFRSTTRNAWACPPRAWPWPPGRLVGVVVPPLLIGAIVIAAAVPSFKRAWAAIRDEKKLNVDFLDSTAITLLTATGFFFPPALMVSLIESGEIIRDLTARRTARANLDLLDSLGRFARGSSATALRSKCRWSR